MRRPAPFAQTTAVLALVATLVCAGVAAQARADSSHPDYTAADVHFMSGMIYHHAQAVLMAGWASSHGAGPSVGVLCDRIVVSQRDEIALMQRWLQARHEDAPDPDAMPGMHPAMMMPGMLTPDQLVQLDHARGPEFDELFLVHDPAPQGRHHHGE